MRIIYIPNRKSYEDFPLNFWGANVRYFAHLCMMITYKQEVCDTHKPMVHSGRRCAPSNYIDL